MKTKMVSYTLETLPPLSDKQLAGPAALAANTDPEIDTSDVAEVTDEEWRHSVRVMGEPFAIALAGTARCCWDLHAGGREMRVPVSGFAIGEVTAVQRADEPAGRAQHRVAGRDVPFHRGTKPRVEVRLAARDQA